MANNIIRHDIEEEVPGGFAPSYSYLRTLESADDRDYIINHVKAEGQIYYNKSLQNTIRVIGDDYLYFLSRKDDCVTYYAKSYKKCTNSWTFLARSFFTQNDIEFNLDQCYADINLSIATIYPCIQDNSGNSYYYPLYIDGTELGHLTGGFLSSGRILKLTVADGREFISDDLFDVAKALIQKLNCAGFENEEPSGTLFPLSDFFNWQIGPNLFGPVYETVSLLSGQFSSDPAISGLVPIPNYVNPSQDPYYIAISARSNVVNNGASNPQTYFDISFADFAKMLTEVFNVYWIVEGYYVRFEHISYFTKTANYDATAPNNLPFNLGKNKFVTDTKDLAKQETWFFANGDYGGLQDFTGLPIIYPNCHNQKSVERGMKNVSTDPEFLANVQPQNDLAGFVLWDLERDYSANSQFNPVVVNGDISGAPRINGRLSVANLLYDLHRHGRPFASGNMNGNPETFLSPVYKKIQENILVQSCCEDEYQKENSLVTTELGDGEIQEANVNYTKGFITFKLKHE